MSLAELVLVCLHLVSALGHRVDHLDRCHVRVAVELTMPVKLESLAVDVACSVADLGAAVVVLQAWLEAGQNGGRLVMQGDYECRFGLRVDPLLELLV